MTDTRRTGLLTPDSLRLAVSRHRAALNSALLLDGLGKWLRFGILFVGLTALCIKLSPYHPRVYLPALFVLLLPFVAAAFIQSLRRFYTIEEAAAWLDLNAHAGGRFLSPDCPSIAPMPPLPSTRIRLLPSAKRVAWPGLFLMGVWLVPPVPVPPPVSPAALRQQAALLEERVDLARERNAIAPELSQSVLRQIDATAENARLHPESAAESLQDAATRLDNALLRSAAAMRSAMNAAKTFSSGSDSDSVNRGSDTATDEEAVQALQQMLAALDQLPQLPPELADQLQQALSQCQSSSPAELGKNAGQCLSKLDKAALQKLAEACQRAFEQQLAQCESCKGGASSGKLPTLSGMNLSTTPSSLTSGSPGQGGVNRGRGDAPLTLGDPTEEDGARFKPTVLEPGKLPVPGVVIGRNRLQADRITPAEFEEPQRSGFLLGNRTGGESFNTDLGPGAQRAAQRYFHDLTEETPHE